jgi:hypothetical protein
LPNYRFTYPYPRFYPDVRDEQGKSLMAMPGDVVSFQATPEDGCWVLTEDAPPAPVEPVQEAPAPAPVPDVPPPAPEPVPAAVEAPVAPPAAEPEPAPPAPAPQAAPRWAFPGFPAPPARA